VVAKFFLTISTKHDIVDKQTVDYDFALLADENDGRCAFAAPFLPHRRVLLSPLKLAFLKGPACPFFQLP
jgi:hypothetical protein